MFELKRAVHSLSEKEAKSLLHFLLLQAEMAEENPQLEGALLQELLDVRTNVLTPKKKDKSISEYRLVHVVFGHSTGGSLKHGLREAGLEEQEKVLVLAEDFLMGPINGIDEEEGFGKRLEWLRDNINGEWDFTDYHKFESVSEEIRNLPREMPIIIWYAENALEHTGLCYVLHLLRDNTNDIIVINTTSQHKVLYDKPDIIYTVLKSGEIMPERLIGILNASRDHTPLSDEKKKHLAKEWSDLSRENALLRVWEEGTAKSVKVDYYDEFIIKTMKYLQGKYGGFLKSARLIGEVMGHSPQYIGDSFIEYRVRNLIYDGVFEIKGLPAAMRFYSVKLRNK